MHIALVLLAQICGVITGAEFLAATVFYFRRHAKVHATAIMTVLILTAVAIHLVFLMLAADTRPAQLILALGLFGLSNILFWSAVIAHGSARPGSVFGEITPETLITTGPYRFVRHPFYPAYVVAFLASSLVSDHWLPFCAT